MGDDGGKGVIIPALFLGCIILGFWIGETMTRLSWEKEAVELGYAQYDNKTGEWKWKSPIVDIESGIKSRRINNVWLLEE